DKLEQQVKILAECERKTRIVCYSNVDVVADNTRTPWNTFVYDNRSDLSDYLIVHNQAIQTSSIIMDASFAKEVRFQDCLKCHQDWDLVLRAKAADAFFAGTSAVLVDYFISADPVNRISRDTAVVHTVEWSEMARHLLSNRARATLYVSRIFPRLPAARSPRMWLSLFWAARPGGAGTITVARAVIRKLLPPRLVARLEKVWRRTRFTAS
ncbi:MAG: hypothetical protein WAW96_12245, partial [Alphaproteobacteria bacterium]